MDPSELMKRLVELERDIVGYDNIKVIGPIYIVNI
jgi:hypothetical protein